MVISLLFLFIPLITSSMNQHTNPLHFSIIFTSDIHATFNPTRVDSFLTGEFPDLVNYVEHLKKVYPEKYVFWFDSGDFSRGTCFSECASPKGEFALDVFADSNLDATTIGENDLRDDESAAQLNKYANGDLENRIITTNIFFETIGQHLGLPYRVFPVGNTESNVLVFGFSAPFVGHPSRIKYYAVETSLNSQTVADGLETPNISLVVCLCHLSMNSSDVERIHEFFTARSLPVLILCGRSHQQLEKIELNAIVAEDGAYLQSFRVIDFTLEPDNPGFQNVKTKWMDMKRSDLIRDLHLQEAQWETQIGQRIRADLQDFGVQNNISALVGCPVSQYSTDFESTNSIYTLILNSIYPALIHKEAFPSIPEDHNLIYLIEKSTMRQPLGFKAVEKGDIFITDPSDRSLYIYHPFTGIELEKLSTAIIDRLDNIKFVDKYKLRNQKIDLEANYSIVAHVNHPVVTLLELEEALGNLFSYSVTENSSRTVLIEYLTTHMSCEKTQKSHIVWSSVWLVVMFLVVAGALVFLFVWSCRLYFHADKILKEMTSVFPQDGMQ
ncbi:hypothetical protein BLNAU_10676 [Blattamonas nauphoetae]|uniref:Calcineurin-like phosphoesterase domain-containing protein n=1 Tax=Blattamonas nauphoetae TaxID=2049346 RepID=A0ABQ9XRK9_9EUKA|nr:hypothetical protein BLNAU_10676 [Blattamonas nauphoetae]